MPELLSPAGSFEKLKAAILYGANAVYLAGNLFGMRSAATNFSIEELKEACDYAHARNVKVYLTVNVMPRVEEYPLLEEYIKSVGNIGIDAMIVADLGVLTLIKEILPDMEIHISTQASTVSANTCKAWHKLGASRVVLARELTFDEIRKIRDNTPDTVELEAFVHGSMCIAYSGRCLLSNYFTGRDANRGQCTQPCRWDYTISEVKRPELELPIEQNERGTFIYSSQDMCMIEHIPALMNSGINSFKIEGRMKSAYYTAVVTNTYRMAMDAYLRDPSNYKFDPQWMRELNSVSHREYCTGFYFDPSTENAKTCSQGGYIREKSYIATASAYDVNTSMATFIQKNKISKGESVEIITPGMTGRSFVANNLFDSENNEIESAPHPAMEFKIKVPFEVKPGDIIRSGSDE